MVCVSNWTCVWQWATNCLDATSLVCEWRCFLSSVWDRRWMICKLSTPCVIWGPMCICILSANTKFVTSGPKPLLRIGFVHLFGSMDQWVLRDGQNNPLLKSSNEPNWLFCHFLFHYLGFSKCVFKTAFKPVQLSRHDRTRARSLPRVKCQVAKLMRKLGLKARNVTLKWNLMLLLLSCG